ncbi:MAG: hypothetical protein JWM25_142 [Thermoleophilia bacterium]|nr:hypothetical protein [Thermoleophilia bacterium]MCZ4495559.1 hypothetical protein [Thermoleophilia bacterium]
MIDAPVTPPAAEPAPRSTSAVLGILGMLALVLIVVVGIVLGVSGRGDGAGADLAEEARSNRVQAVYLSNDNVYFGTLEGRSGDWVELRDAFFLRSGTPDAKDPEAVPTTEVVPANVQVGGDGNLVINAHEIVLVQNLAADSDIARTVEDARE